MGKQGRYPIIRTILDVPLLGIAYALPAHRRQDVLRAYSASNGYFEALYWILR